jgi:ABC-type sugar transport system permease subunit
MFSSLSHDLSNSHFFSRYSRFTLFPLSLSNFSFQLLYVSQFFLFLVLLSNIATCLILLLSNRSGQYLSSIYLRCFHLPRISPCFVSSVILSFALTHHQLHFLFVPIYSSALKYLITYRHLCCFCLPLCVLFSFHPFRVLILSMGLFQIPARLNDFFFSPSRSNLASNLY